MNNTLDIKNYDDLYFFNYDAVCPPQKSFVKTKKYGVTLVMSGTPNYAFAIANVLIGLQRHSPNFVDRVIIYHTGISKNDQICIGKIIKCKFIDYKPSAFSQLQQTGAIERFTLASFAIYEIFNCLKDSHHVLYLDGDTLIHKDIRGIINFGPVAMRLSGREIGKALGASIPNIDDNRRTGNTGVVIVSDTINYEGLTEQCYAKTLEYNKTLVLPDQAILNLVLIINNITINHLPKIYNTSSNDFRPDMAITHQLMGKNFKCWSHGIVNFLDPEWEINNNIWLSIGGKGYDGDMFFKNIAKALQSKSIEKLCFLFSVYENRILSFLEEFARQYCLPRNISYKLNNENYTLYITIAKKPLSRFEIKVDPNIIKFKLFTKNKQIFNILNNNNLLNNEKYKFTFKDDYSGGHITMSVKLSADMLSKEYFGLYNELLTHLLYTCMEIIKNNNLAENITITPIKKLSTLDFVL